MKKSIRIFIITLLTMAALDAACQTRAKGDIICDDGYKCYIQEIQHDGSYEWVRYAPWEYFGSYRVKIDPFDTLETIFINSRTQDTTFVTFTANKLTRRLTKNVYLSGNKQVIK